MYIRRELLTFKMSFRVNERLPTSFSRLFFFFYFSSPVFFLFFFLLSLLVARKIGFLFSAVIVFFFNLRSGIKMPLSSMVNILFITFFATWVDVASVKFGTSQAWINRKWRGFTLGCVYEGKKIWNCDTSVISVFALFT